MLLKVYLKLILNPLGASSLKAICQFQHKRQVSEPKRG